MSPHIGAARALFSCLGHNKQWRAARATGDDCGHATRAFRVSRLRISNGHAAIWGLPTPFRFRCPLGFGFPKQCAVITARGQSWLKQRPSSKLAPAQLRKHNYQAQRRQRHKVVIAQRRDFNASTEQ
jgi:hypothetical protein